MFLLFPTVLLLATTVIIPSIHADSGILTFYGCSDVHFGHDVTTSTNGTTTSLELNIATVNIINQLPNNATWPVSMGGGTVYPAAGVVITGDLVDNGYTQYYEWSNFTAVYGLTGKDGLLAFPVYEGKGNHDGGQSTDTGEHFVAASIIARNQIRKLDPLFNITGISATGLHYSWRWSISNNCSVNLVMLNLYAGHNCSGCAPNNCFYGPPCYSGFVYPEESIDFLQAMAPSFGQEPVIVMQHYCFDSYSDDWYSENERQIFYNTLSTLNTIGILCGHTHVVNIYSINGTDTMNPVNQKPGINVFNIPSTQKEDSNGNPLPSEFMVFELSVDDYSNGLLRVGSRIGYDWNMPFLSMSNFTCSVALND